jgi:F-type H+-transporting ATPase subunit b
VTAPSKEARGARANVAARWVLLATMTVLTAWPVWAWATQQHPLAPAAASHEPRPGNARPEHAASAKHETTRPAAEHAAAEKSDKAEKAEGAEENEAPAPMNWTQFGGATPPFLAMLINFGILAAGYYWLGRKPIAAGLLHRRDAIARDIEDAQRMRKEAEERAKHYQAQLDNLQQEMRTARDALVRAGEAERDRVVREAEAKAERMQKDAQFLVEQEIKQVRQDLWRDAVEVAVTAAQELLQQRVTPADQERLAEEYLTELGAPARPAAASPAVRETAP